MYKYFQIYKSELMSSLQYTLNNLLRIFNFILIIFVFMNLWNYIYSDPNELINGYSKNQMIWYVIVTEIIWGITEGRKYCRKISNDVKSGNIAYIMNKPFSYIGYALSSHLGETAVKGSATIIICILFGIIYLKMFPNVTILSVLIVIISMVLAVFIDLLFVTTIGLVSFIIEDSQPLYWIYSKFTLVLGVTFPIEYFPDSIAKVLRYSPVYVTCYGPAKLFVDFNYLTAAEILVAQIIYLIIAFTLCYSLYQKGVRKLNVTGG